jgi:peptidoglycan/xylan/chitin deacetylase (PgdA/CDA1 family)
MERRNLYWKNVTRTVILALLLVFVAILSGCTPDAKQQEAGFQNTALTDNFSREFGAIIRGDTNRKSLSLVFTGDQFADGGMHIARVLEQQKVQGSFFFTGNFYRNPEFKSLIQKLKQNDHYLGAHSDKHLLYCDWENRDSMFVTRNEFHQDLIENYREMHRFGIRKEDARFFLPPYEWYNDSISSWTNLIDLQLINYSSGTKSHTDYTTPQLPNYTDSQKIFESIISYEKENAQGLNGFILLIHIGTDPKRTDKLYNRLEELIIWIKKREYAFERIDDLL